MIFFKNQKEKSYTRNNKTDVIIGAEPYEFGRGKHGVLFIHGLFLIIRDLFLKRPLKFRGYFRTGVPGGVGAGFRTPFRHDMAVNIVLIFLRDLIHVVYIMNPPVLVHVFIIIC